jgi:hypothetical protein
MRMIGKILAGVAGARAAKTSGGSGAGGALLGVAGATLLRRLSIPAMIALAAGGYAVKKWTGRREPAAEPAQPKRPAPKRKPRKAGGT